MKTATLDVGGMLSMLDYQAVEKQLGRLPGVHRVAASIASNSVTVAYDETVTSIGALWDVINSGGSKFVSISLPLRRCSTKRVFARRRPIH